MLSPSSVFLCVLIAFQRSAYLFRLSVDSSLRRWIQITYLIAMYDAAELPNLLPMSLDAILSLLAVSVMFTCFD